MGLYRACGSIAGGNPIKFVTIHGWRCLFKVRGLERAQGRDQSNLPADLLQTEPDPGAVDGLGCAPLVGPDWRCGRAHRQGDSVNLFYGTHAGQFSRKLSLNTLIEIRDDSSRASDAHVEQCGRKTGTLPQYFPGSSLSDRRTEPNACSHAEMHGWSMLGSAQPVSTRIEVIVLPEVLAPQPSRGYSGHAQYGESTPAM